MRLRKGHGLTLVTPCVFIPAGLPASYCGTVRSGRFFTGGQRKQLVLKTIEAAQHNIRLMGYSFTSPEVAGALISAKRRGVDVRGTGLESQYREKQ